MDSYKVFAVAAIFPYPYFSLCLVRSVASTQCTALARKVNNLYFTVTFLLTAVFNMCVVSYDRLTAIVLPMEQRITMRSAKMTMFLTWIVGLTISIPFAIYRNYKVSFESVLSEFRRMNCAVLCCAMLTDAYR